MEKIVFYLDETPIETEKGKTILQAALENGIYIPHLCYHPDLKPAAVCRLCMVEIENRGLVTSCNTPVEQGIKVYTETEDVQKVRKVAAELLLLNHPFDCLSCDQNTECELQKAIHFIGVDEETIGKLCSFKKDLPADESNPFFIYDPARCVLCGICIRTCSDIVGVSNLDYAMRGYDSMVSTFGNKPMLESRCVSCGECVVRCPVGALRHKNYQPPARKVKTTCVYCGTGCGILLGVRGDRVVFVDGDRENPINWGRLCAKGRYGYEFINHPERLKKPLIKKNGKFVEASWDEALDIVAENFKKYIGDSFACLSSAKATNEDNYVIQKFTRAVMKTNNIDHCARLCHAPSVAGLAQSFGSGAMTNSIGEIKDARCIFAIGTNTTSAHPIIALEMKEAVRRGAKLIVANPKRIDLCEYADLFIQHRPGTDVALLMGMAKIIYDEKLHDEEFINNRTEGFEEFLESLKDFSIDFVEEITGVDRNLIIEAARIYATSKPSMLFYSMGITQHTHGTDNVLATSNLALLTGNVGRPSSGVNPLRGQNNVQGACDMGALPNVYPGYQKVNIPEIKEKFERAWNTSLPSEPGLTHTEIFDAIADGRIKALYQVGENPRLSEANAKHVEEALNKIDFLVVQDIFLTETAMFADVVLPSCSYAEKDGTFTNTERRVQRVRKAIPPVGESKPDWLIVCEIAKRMGASGFDYENPKQIMDEINMLTPSYGGITYERIEKEGLQWPCPDINHPGTRYLHKDRFATPSGKGRFKPLKYRPSYELPDSEFPLILTTDRSLFHFHTGTMTRKGGLSVLMGEEQLQINPLDAEKFGLKSGEFVYVASRRGKVKARVRVTDIAAPGVVSMTFHFHETPTNEITSPAIDPVAKIPETKVCAVRIEKI